MKKIIKKLHLSIVIISLTSTIILCACKSTSHITTPATPEDITRSVDSSKWIFTPTQVRPQYGRSRQVSGSSYTVAYTGNRLTLFLPYYGRAYGGADVLSGRGPLDFTAVDFSTDKQQTKAGEWKIIIKPKDYSEVQSMNFVLYNNGSANLDIIMTNRSAISYTGNVGPLK